MDSEVRAKIGETFKLTDGPQVIPTNLPATDPVPGKVGDPIEIHSRSGRNELSRIGSIEYVLMAAGGEYYAFLLDGPLIPDLQDFTDGTFRVRPASREQT